jgi:hypothetical protein
MALSLQVGLAPDASSWVDSWYYVSVGSDPNGQIGYTYNSNCGGWRSNLYTISGRPQRGSIFIKSNPTGTHYPAQANCDEALPIACCDSAQ